MLFTNKENEGGYSVMKIFNENFTRAVAEGLGLMFGCMIQYFKPMENNQNRKIIKNGTVYQLWKSHFIVIWDKGGWKETFPYELIESGKIKIKG